MLAGRVALSVAQDAGLGSAAVEGRCPTLRRDQVAVDLYEPIPRHAREVRCSRPHDRLHVLPGAVEQPIGVSVRPRAPQAAHHLVDGLVLDVALCERLPDQRRALRFQPVQGAPEQHALKRPCQRSRIRLLDADRRYRHPDRDLRRDDALE